MKWMLNAGFVRFVYFKRIPALGCESKKKEEPKHE